MGKNKERDAAFKKAYKDKMKASAKDRKKLLKEKRAKLIVKNLAFNATTEDLRTHFEKFGIITNVEILKKDDGKMLGYGFVQFDAVQKAAKAKHHLNGKDFLGRKLECDFAMPKKKFQKKVNDEQHKQYLLDREIKKEPVDADSVEIKVEPMDAEVKEEGEDVEEDSESDSDDDQTVKEAKDAPIVTIKESDNEEAEDDDDEEVEEDEEQEEKKEIIKVDEDSENSDDDSDLDEELEEEEENKVEISGKKQRFESHDVNEGKTIFVKNLPFEATNEDLRECMQQFGPVYYALVCVDKMTEHSRGTAFVKFRSNEDADKCLQAGTELTCLGTILDCHKAMGRQEMENKKQEKERQKQTDSRNLYLIKEGVIMAGSKAAEGVSASDMAKRLQLEQYKTQMLRNLNMFIAKTRLIVHNLPATWDDAKLRALLKKHAGPGAVIREARVMRNMRNVDANGVGLSKEHGFVSFTTHEHALNALRSLNNNPRVFSDGKRPIVAFSIENRVMVNAKQKRMEKSRQLNPLAKQFDAKAKEEHQDYKKRKLQEQQEQENGQEAKQKNGQKGQPKVNEGAQFSGMQAKPGQVNKMRSRFKLTTQAKLHHEQLKAEKKQKKNQTKSLQHRKEEFIRQEGQKINKNKRDRDAKDDGFAKLVNSYKSKLMKPNGKANSNKLHARGGWADV